MVPVPTRPIRTSVAIGLGSNVGDRRAHLDYAAARLATILEGLRISRYLETAPFGVSEDQPPFLNAVVVGEVSISARDLLNQLLAIERERGRERPYRWAPRTLDLDLLLYGDAIIDEPGLAVPHPRLRERRFVLEPLAEVAPNRVDPVTGLTVGELLNQLAP
jgi:2-amino-4-hydroxy-6-hydroxymethyldihydropteridine diphosphokinase